MHSVSAELLAASSFASRGAQERPAHGHSDCGKVVNLVFTQRPHVETPGFCESGEFALIPFDPTDACGDARPAGSPASLEERYAETLRTLQMLIGGFDGAWADDEGVRRSRRVACRLIADALDAK
jgi:hypothetical protein